MTTNEGGVRPAVNRPAADDTVTHATDTERARRARYKAARELDLLLGGGRTDHATPDWSQFAMGIPERRAAA